MSHAADQLRSLLMRHQYVSVEDFAALEGIGRRKATEMLDSWCRHGRVKQHHTDTGPLYTEAEPIPGIRRKYGHPWLTPKPTPKPTEKSMPKKTTIDAVKDQLRGKPWQTAREVRAGSGARSAGTALSQMKTSGEVVSKPKGDHPSMLLYALAEDAEADGPVKLNEEAEDVDAIEQQQFDEAYTQGQADLRERILTRAAHHRASAEALADRVLELLESIRLTKIEHKAAERLAVELEALAAGVL